MRALLLLIATASTLIQGIVSEALLPRVSSARVLAVINGGWGLQKYATPERYIYLDRQLRSYVQLCEEGYDVHVVLATYEGWNYVDVVRGSDYLCVRLMKSMPISVALFPFEPLPNGTFGTAGTLAFQHRRVFFENRHDYDVFIVQEDDVLILPHNVIYFAQWSQVLQDTKFYPAHSYYEIVTRDFNSLKKPGFELQGSHVFVDWRLKKLKVKDYMGHPLLIGSHIGSYLYMLSQKMLLEFSADPQYLNMHSFAKGEFNVFWGSNRWIAPHYSLVVPLSSWKQSLVHHQPNKYIHMEFKHLDGGVPIREMFARPTLPELSGVLEQCKVNNKQNECYQCLLESKAAALKVLKATAVHNMSLSVQCQKD